MLFVKYWKFYNIKNNLYVSWFRNKWFLILLEVIEYNRRINFDWSFDYILYFLIKVDMIIYIYMLMYYFIIEIKLGNEFNVII